MFFLIPAESGIMVGVLHDADSDGVWGGLGGDSKCKQGKNADYYYLKYFVIHGNAFKHYRHNFKCHQCFFLQFLISGDLFSI